jgi:hypothetical protein
MSDSPDDAGPPVLTPIQRALAAKKAALEAKSGPPKGRKTEQERAAAHKSASKSKPWMKA